MRQTLAFTLIFIIYFAIDAKGQNNSDVDLNKPIRYGVDVSVNFISALPQAEFKTNFDKMMLPGVNFDAALTPSKNAPLWKAGAQLEVLFGGSKKNDWNGLRLRSSTDFISINFINRFLPEKSMTVKPFLELALGFNMSYTSSTYEIYDKATFWEKFLFGEEDQVENITVKEHNDTDKNLSIGAGIIVKNTFMLQVKYNYIPEVVYVSPGAITIENNEINYEYNTSPVKLISVSLGLTFNTRKLETSIPDW